MIRLALRLNKQKFVMAIARLEFGVCIFCRKQAENAEAEDKPGLARQMRLQSQEEERHGRMLSALLGAKNRIVSDAATGRFVSLETSDGTVLKTRKGEEVYLNLKDVEWRSRGQELTFFGLVENFNGISRNYLSLKFFFGDKEADSFPWEDKLAFMTVLEEQTKKFYQNLHEVVGDTPLGRIAAQIASEEGEHSTHLKQCMSEYYITPIPDFYIHKWRSRIPWAMIGLLFDIPKIFFR